MIILIGPPGVGKSTVLREIARASVPRLSVIDLDNAIEQDVGLTVQEIFAQHGEKYFRDLEYNNLVKSINFQVIATGGGIVTRARNREYLRNITKDNNSKIILLEASLAVLTERLEGETHRPLLTQDNITNLLLARMKYYYELADIVISTNFKAPSDIALELLAYA